jgi:hypothetical protein
MQKARVDAGIRRPRKIRLGERIEGDGEPGAAHEGLGPVGEQRLAREQRGQKGCAGARRRTLQLR